MRDRTSDQGLRPTFVHPLAAQYLAPGGPWDRPDLDRSFHPAQGALSSHGATGVAVIDDQNRLDATNIERHVSQLSGSLRASGVKHGQVVSWQLPNGVCAWLLYRACWRIGAVAAPLHHRMGPAEVEGALAQVEPVVVIARRGSPASEQLGAIVLDGSGDPDSLTDLLPTAQAVAPGSVALGGPDLAVALFTSGSTGIPKAVLHTHRGLSYKASLMVEVHGLGPGDAVLMPAPLAHVSGLLNGVLLPCAARIPAILMSSWDPERAIRIIETEHVSFMGAPPVFFSQMVGAAGFSTERVRSMKLISTGGASVSPAFVDSTAQSFGCRVKRTYGSTEAPTVTTSRSSNDPEKARATDGRPLGMVEIEVHDPESGKALGVGEVGELWIRGPELFEGYAHGAATERVIASGGWYRSGDLGTLDDEEWLRVVGRLSDIVIRAGENISSSEVEAVLEAHPDIRHAVAVGVPDTELGERLAAFVVSARDFDLDACRQWFAVRGVTRFKTPEIVIQLPELPLLAAGKADRAALKKMAAQVAQRPATQPERRDMAP